MFISQSKEGREGGQRGGRGVLEEELARREYFGVIKVKESGEERWDERRKEQWKQWDKLEDLDSDGGEEGI